MGSEHQGEKAMSPQVLDAERQIVFIVEEAAEGGFTARAESGAIFTEADTFEELQAAIRDAVRCHFEPDEVPASVTFHGMLSTE